MDMLMTELAAGTAAERSGDHVRARAQFERVIARDPNNVAAWLGLSRVMPTADQALRCVEHILHSQPQHRDALAAKAMIKMQLLVEEAAVVKTTHPHPSTSQRRYLLGEALVAAGVITTDQLTLALQEQERLSRKQQPQRLGEILLRLNLVRPDQLEAALAAQISMLSTSISDHGAGRFGAFLIRHDFVTPAELEQGLAEQARLKQAGKHMLLGEVLVETGALSRSQLNHALLTWQQWCRKVQRTRDDPYAPVMLPTLTTRSRRSWRGWFAWLRPFRKYA